MPEEAKKFDDQQPINIPKPPDDDNAWLERFKSKTAPNIAGVKTLLPPLSDYKISEAGDYVRLHSDPSYWSAELCFVDVPIKGQKKAARHLIDEELAVQYLPSKRIIRCCLVLASKPHDAFFLCRVPTQNLDNIWNSTAIEACEKAKEYWLQATSQGEENKEGYQLTYAVQQDVFPEPEWPALPLVKLIRRAYEARDICSANHPGLLRLIGAK